MGKIKGSELTAEIKTINPQVAKQLLATSPRNRGYTGARILRHKQAMDLDEWVIAQPLMLDGDDRLLEGHHRMRAVIACGKPIEFLVISGYDRKKTFGRIDDTAPRQLRHWLQVANEPLPEVLAPLIVMAAKDAAGYLPTTTAKQFQQTGPEGLDFLDAHPELRDVVTMAPGTVTPLCSRSMLCFCAWKFAKLDTALAKTFLIDLVTNASTGIGDPVSALHDRLKANRASRTKLRKTEVLALIIKAWNAERAGKKIERLMWITSGPSAEKFPKIV